MTDPTIASWSRENDLLFQLRQLREENERLRTALEQQAEPPPEWPLIKNILAVFGLDAIAFVAAWKAAQQQAEPVQERITRIAWDERGVRTVNGIPDDAPQRLWVGLTEAERIDIIDEEIDAPHFALAQAIEAKLKERNT